jgi:predicted metalloprotease
MTHRHYGLRVTKPPATDTGPATGGALSGGAIVGGIVVIVIVLGFIAYEVTKLVAHAGNTTTSTAAQDPRVTRAL